MYKISYDDDNNAIIKITFFIDDIFTLIYDELITINFIK